jgi:DNA-binding NarL/FixJ family response regulator
MRTAITTLARQARIDLAAPAPAASSEPGPEGLTPREREVIALLSNGLSNADIARTLYISEKTASVHVSNILRKLGVTSRIQAAAAARNRPAQNNEAPLAWPDTGDRLQLVGESRQIDTLQGWLWVAADP